MTNEKLIISISGLISEKNKKILTLENSNIYFVERNALSGAGNFTELIIPSVFLIKEISRIIRLLITLERNVSIRYGDLHIQNVSHEQAIEILEKIDSLRNKEGKSDD